MSGQGDKVKFDPRVVDKIDRDFYHHKRRISELQRLRPSTYLRELKRIQAIQ